MLRCSAPAGACSAFGEPFSWLSDIVVVDASGVTVLVVDVVGDDDQVRVDGDFDVAVLDVLVLVLVIVDVDVWGNRLLDSLGGLAAKGLADVVDGEADRDHQADAEANEDLVKVAVARDNGTSLAIVLVVTCNHVGRQSFCQGSK